MTSVAASLAEQQRWLFERVIEAEHAFAGARTSERVVAGALGARERVAVYRHGYVARLVECLADDYPALQHALGRESFAQLCRDYVQQHPPRGPSLNFYGARFAAYCGGRSEPWSSFAAELAELEWALVEAIHASDGQRLEVAALAALAPRDWERARLLPSPTLRLLRTRYPVGRYYRAFREGEPLAQRLPAAERSALAVCRRGADVWRIQIVPELEPLLVRLIAGAPLLAALEASSAEPPEPRTTPEALQRAFRDWVACGMFSGLEL